MVVRALYYNRPDPISRAGRMDQGSGLVNRFVEKEKVVKIFLNVLAVLVILAGGVWFLQGINVLPGSFMTGNPQWAIYGSIAVLVGIVILVFTNRRKSSP